jgi:D-alanyl-D-alanine carboxypeptidase/D-alanyl-D-alanine-endopeptidase (penicillin-binding protein 4)
MTRRTGYRRVLATALAGPLAAALAQAPAAGAPLPPAVLQALATSRVPAESMSALVLDAASGERRLAWQSGRPGNPASLVKLVTTYAALDLLGPAYSWRTPVWLAGPVRDGTLEGSLVLRGSGDPKLLHERVWQMLRRVRQLGVQTIAGDIVIDRSAFAPPERAPDAFDNQPHRAYNVQPDALMLAHKSMEVSVQPDPALGMARLRVEPALDGLQPPPALPLDPQAPCDDWRARLGARVGGEGRLQFEGRYPAACGERKGLLADPQPETFNARLLRSVWHELGGRLAGQVREGPAPLDQPPSFEFTSPPLAEVVRDINKLSSNVMAEQLFLTLAAQRHPDRQASGALAREVLLDWMRGRTGALADDARLDNGSGLSRTTRLSPELLGQLLRQAFAGPVMPEMLASLPVSGLDGTMAKSVVAQGRAHLKTGSLRDVAALAGYTLGASGRRYVVVAMIEHAQATAARPALDALVQWVLDDAPATAGRPAWTPTP